jgi:hypothetical protein
MSQSARKHGDSGSGKLTDSLSVDDPSIPVLTERLTLPPLDLNLDFRLPERPASQSEDLAPPLAEMPLPPLESFAPIEPIEPIEPDAQQPPASSSEEGEPTVQAPADDSATDDSTPAEEEQALAFAGTSTSVEPPEATDAAPRVPTSLLVSNIDTLLATPPGATPYREADEFDLTQADGGRASPMQTDLREMILLELARRLPTEVETIVRRHLEGAIEEAVRRFAAEVRIALAASLREIVDRAVKAELDRLKVPHS